MTQTKNPLTYTFHYWGALCWGDFVQGLMSGGFCPRPEINDSLKMIFQQ